MNLIEVLDGLSCVSLRAVALALRAPSQLSRYISYCLKRYDELAGRGLPARGPVVPSVDMTVTIPAYSSGGGMFFNELVIMARVVRVLNPKMMFEMGTYDGLTTAVMMLNSGPDSQVVTLDLPPTAMLNRPVLDADGELVDSRNLASIPRKLGLTRYTQLLQDSMEFDPSPYLDSVELGFVDAAHDLKHVRNDTEKMAQMMKDEGLVMWHDYGGKGALRPLAKYLESLAKVCPLYRIPGTALAWGLAGDLKRALREKKSGTNQQKKAEL